VVRIRITLIDQSDLVRRSPTIATVEVYGTLMSCLLRRGNPLEAIEAYGEMVRSRRISPNAQSYTLLLTAIGRAARNSTSSKRKEYLQKANDIYSHISADKGRGSLMQRLHFNAYIKVCVSCADQGGWERAYTLFNSILQSPTRSTQLDTISISTMLSMCAENRSEDGYKATIDIWNTFLKLKSEESDLVTDKRLRLFNIDSRLIMNVLLTCIRTKNMNDAMFGLGLIEKYIGFPTKTGDKFFYSEYREDLKHFELVAIDTKSLDILLRYASRIKNTDLALLWSARLNMINS